MVFDRLEKLQQHDHYIAKHADLPYVTYRLVDAESPLGAMVLSHPTEDAIEVCLTEKIAIPGRAGGNSREIPQKNFVSEISPEFPGIFYVLWRGKALNFTIF